jgi:hypothetical protein
VPKNEFTEFQRRVLAAVDRVLAAVEKPKRGRLLAIINSSFFLWLMSVLLLTIGGSYITNHKQCLDDAEKIIDRRRHLRAELYSRDIDYVRRVKEATTLREAAYTFPDKRGSIFSDLANLTYQELQGEYHTLDNRIRYEEFHDLVDKFRFDHDHLFFHYMGRIHARTIKNKLFSADDEAHLLRSKQLDNNAFYAIQNFNNKVEFGYEFLPDCTAFNTAAIAFGYRLPIVFAEAPSGSSKEDLIREIEEVEQANKDAQLQAKKDAQLLEGEPH